MSKQRKTWIPVIRRRGEPVLLNSYLLHAYQDQYHQEIMLLPRGIHDNKYINGWVIFEANDIGVFEDNLAKQLTLEYLAFLIAKCRHESDRLLSTAHDVRSKAPYGSMTNIELVSLFMTYSGDVIRVMPFLAGIVILEGVLGKKIEEKLTTHIQKYKIKADSGSYLTSLIFPQEKTNPSLALIELYELAVQVHSDSHLHKLFDLRPTKALAQINEKFPKFRDKFNTYLEKYDFMDMEFYVGSPVSPKELFIRVRDVVGDANDRLSRIERDNKNAKRDFEKATRSLKLTPELRSFIDSTQAIHYLRQYRADALFKAGRDVLGLMTTIGERLKVGYDELLALTWTEISKSLIKGRLVVDKRTITARKKNYGMVLVGGKHSFITGHALDKELAGLPTKKEKVKRIEGSVAFRGFYRGWVVIVTHPDDVDKVKQGDVLVSPMTSPYYVPAMVRAGAIVTDEGGILSHAAIISRELGVPCVVGTKIATRVFKDGDFVEVDAEKGVVRKIKDLSNKS